MKQLSLIGRAGPKDPPPDKVEGVLDRIAFVNEETGWSVVRLIVGDRAEPVTAVGPLLGAQPGETLRLSGRWEEDRRFGRQFRAESFITITPATLLGMEKYLGSGLVHGIGKVMARRLVKHFGLETLDVIEASPGRLTEVEGIGPKRRAQIEAAWAEQRAIKEVMLFLQSHGVQTAFAIKIFKRYGQRAIQVVQENPYRLAVDIFGIGFRSADQIALNLGLPMNSPQRAEAGLLHVLGEMADDGHLFCPLEPLVERAMTMLELEEETVRGALEALCREERVVLEPNAGEAAVDEGPPSAAPGQAAVYLGGLLGSERGIVRSLARLLTTPAGGGPADLEQSLGRFEQEAGLELAPQQRDAVTRAATAKVLVITGGPGTGKTTIVNAVLRVLAGAKQRIQLCAPTGRAAKRLGETTGQEARTIHRLLEFDPRTMDFMRNAEHPIEADLLVVDEVSMVDAPLFHHLLRAVPPACRLVLVGDVDQLPSVGPGAVLLELISSGVLPVARLTEIFRQAQESLIVVNAHRVNAGELPRLRQRAAEPEADAEELPDYFFIGREKPEDLLATLEEVVCQRLPARFGVDPRQDVQVLTPMNRGSLGAVQLNRLLQGRLNPEGTAVVRGGRIYRVGDKVMQLRNNYELGVFNGDIGRIEGVDEEGRTALVCFDERAVTYEFSDLDELSLGYACTIHKSQGSEYPVVVLLLHTQHYTMLRRNLLYTALTRARRLVVVLGSPRAVALAVRNSDRASRYTRLAVRLRQALERQSSLAQ